MDYGLPSSGLDIIDTGFTININFWLVVLFWLAIIFLIFFIIKKIIKYLAVNSSYFDHIVYLVRLPKERPGDKEEGFNLQKLHEEIARGETVFSSIGGLRAQRGFKAWLFGRRDHFSFELVSNHKIISFHIVAPRNMGQYIEQQVHAHYPEAIMEEIEDYNIFHPEGKVVAGYMKTKRDFIFPLKTYEKMEDDPMNSIINIMSKMDADESMAVQVVVRSAKASWHKRISGIVSKVNQGKTLSQALGQGVTSKIIAGVGDIASSADPASSKQDELEPQKKMSEAETEALKSIEDKNTKAGLDVNIRIVVSAKNEGRANIYLDNMVSAFSQYNYYEYGNSFRNQVLGKNKEKTINNFIYRRFNDGTDFLLNTEELTSIFHFPLKDAETPNILWLTAKHAPAPTNTPEEGIILGSNMYRGVTKEVRIKSGDRLRHMYIIGKSGGGKSQFVANMAIQDILNGEGICVLDPHGDLIEDILKRIPPERAEDVIVFSPADTERPMGLNLLEFDPRYPEQKTFVINEVIGIFDKLYDLKTTGGPIFEQYMRNALLLIMSDPESGSTLMEVPKVLSDPEFRNMKLEKCKDMTVVEFWRKEAEKAGGDAALANVVPYITSKLTQFISNDIMRPIIAQQNSAFNIRDIMDKQKILLIDLPKGAIGQMNAYLLGMILVGKILMAALSRTDISQENRKNFYLYIDEFQNFTTNSITQILSEARKYGLGLTISHQYIGQMVVNNDTAIKDAVFGNVGTMVLFRIGPEDAEFMEKEFSPVFNQFDLINIEMFTAYAKLLIDNTASKPFSLKSPWPIAGNPRDDMASRIRSLSRLKYGRDRNIIEAEITKRSKLL